MSPMKSSGASRLCANRIRDRCRHRRNRRNRRRYRVAALFRSDPPVSLRAIKRLPQYPSDLCPLYQGSWRGQNKADTTFRAGVARNRDLARHHPLPLRNDPLRKRQGKNQPLLQRPERRGHR